MSSHPGCTLDDAIELAEYLRDIHHQPEQVQDFYPTPGTLSTTMYYTGLDPRDMSEVYVPKTAKEKAMQRALIQYRNPKNYDLVYEALVQANRKDLIDPHAEHDDQHGHDHGHPVIVPPVGGFFFFCIFARGFRRLIVSFGTVLCDPSHSAGTLLLSYFFYYNTNRQENL